MVTQYLILSITVLIVNIIITRYDLASHFYPILPANYYFYTNERSSRKNDLLIAVISAREKVEQRQILRETWLSMTAVENLNTKYVFVIGDKSCPIHPHDRRLIYNCDQLQFNINEINENKTFYTSSISKKLTHGFVHKALHFQVHHPVILSKLGIALSTLTNSTKTVILIDAVQQVEVARTFFSAEKPEKYVIIGGFAYRPIEAVILPKNFEGVLYVNSSQVDDFPHFALSEVTEMDDAGGILHFDMLETEFNVPISFANEINKHLSVSMGFSVYNVDELLRFVNGSAEREEEWLKRCDEIEQKLTFEMENHDDIALVNNVDVYRHLPQKLLAFLAATDRFHFGYMLKVDDDTFIHLPKLVSYIRQHLSVQNSINIWSGRFRYNWMVQRVGKWKETEYSSAVYPPFACGTANLLSENLIQLLADNSFHLHHFQGEDVSLGIWLSAFAPRLVSDIRWQCDSGCVVGAWSRGQLSSEQIRESWECFKRTNQICCSADTKIQANDNLIV